MIRIDDLHNEQMSGLFEATVEATEEAIYNSLLKAETVTSNGRTVEALPLERHARGAASPRRDRRGSLTP